MLFCSRTEALLPRDSRRRSVALWRFLPVGSVEAKVESRRWDSFKSRCRARSFLRLAASVPSSSGLSLSLAGLSCLVVDVDVVGGIESEDGGFAD